MHVVEEQLQYGVVLLCACVEVSLWRRQVSLNS